MEFVSKAIISLIFPQKLSTKLVLIDEIRVKEAELTQATTLLTQLVREEMQGLLESYEKALDEFMTKNPGYVAETAIKTEADGEDTTAKDQPGRKVFLFFLIAITCIFGILN